MDNPSPAESAVRKNKLILFVDDSSQSCELFKILLEGEGYQVVTACDPDEALKKVSQCAPDLIITDLMMPGTGGGYGIIKRLQVEGTSHIPIIAMSASGMDLSTEQMLREEANVVEFIPKPFQKSLLVDVLSRLLKTPPQSGPAKPS